MLRSYEYCDIEIYAFCHKDIHDLLESWAEFLEEASAIFLRAPSYNKTIFFGGRGAPMDKTDQRVRTLPFATRRATFSEIKRAFDLLSTLHIYRMFKLLRFHIFTVCLSITIS